MHSSQEPRYFSRSEEIFSTARNTTNREPTSDTTNKTPVKNELLSGIGQSKSKKSTAIQNRDREPTLPHSRNAGMGADSERQSETEESPVGCGD
jgi:hypothetical protein